MSIKSLVYACLAAVVTAISFAASAADSGDTGTKGANAGEPTERPAAVGSKPHSHMQEKTGVAPSAPAKTPAKKPSKNKHFHPRDK